VNDLGRTVEPNGQRVQWKLINIFRYTDDDRLVEEWTAAPVRAWCTS